MGWMPCGHPKCDKCIPTPECLYIDDGGSPHCEYRGANITPITLDDLQYEPCLRLAKTEDDDSSHQSDL